MEPTKVLLIIALAAFSSTSAFNTVTPWDKEVVYNWTALVKAGTYFPARFASQTVLHGKIHVQSNKNSTHVKISDLTYKLYNGVLDHVQEHQAHSVPVPNEVHDLHNVFKVVYDTHGHVMGIATEDHEKEFSRNMKKAIASIFQVDHTVVKEEEHHHHHHAFVTKEHSIYGYADVDYNVVHHHHDDHIEVQKMHDMHHSKHMYHYFFTNTELIHCELDFEEPIMHDSFNKYIIEKQEGHRLVKHIEALGGVYYYPEKAKSDAQYVVVNQTFELLEVVPVQEHFQVKTEHYEDHLNYHVSGDVNVETIPDLTNGRHVINYEKLMPQVQEMLQEVHHYLHEDHIHTKEPDTKQGQLINRIQRVLKYFTVEKLEELHKILSGPALDVFHHMLPLVGTKATTHYIKHLIVAKKVTDEVAVEMLEHYPEHVVIPTVTLVTELEELIHLDDSVSWNVRKMAILSFASLIHKSHHYHHVQYHNNQHHQHDDLNHDLEQPYEKYVVEYVTKAKTVKDYKIQMTYIVALSNMQLHSIIKHMQPAINGEWWESRDLRFLSLWSVIPSVLKDEHSEAVIETLWPIFADRDEHTEMRITAYYFIMESQPSHSRLRNIFWYMMTEPNEEVYHYHYTYAHAMMQNNEPCKQQFKTKMAQMMKFTHPPSHGLSTAHLYDYRDLEYGYSAGIEHHYINTNVSHIHSAIVRSQNLNVYLEEYVYYLKIHGTHPYQTHYPANLHFLIPILSETGGVQVEVVIAKQGHVINTYYFDEHNLHELSSVLDFIKKDSHSVKTNMLDIHYHKHMKNIMTTTLGTPVLFEYMMPVVHQHNISVTKESTNKVANVHIHNRHINWVHTRHGLSFYNPIADVWQGVNRYHAYDSVVPIHLDVTLNMQQKSLQVSWTKHDNPQMNVAGIRSHVKQMVFVKDDHHSNVLVQSSPHCKEFQIVSNGKEFRNDYTLLHEDDLNTGHKWHVSIYDSGYHVSNGTLNPMIHHFTQPWTKHYESPFSHLWMSMANWHHHMVMMPKPGIYGMMVRVEPSEEHVVSNIDFSVRVNGDFNKDSYHYTPGGRWSTRFTYSIKNKEQSLKTWDLNAMLEMNAGHTVNNVKMQLTRKVPHQDDYTVCVDGVKKWTKKGVAGHVNIAMSQTPDGKCNKDETVIDVTMTGERSHEQNHEHHIYGACHYVIPYSVPHYHTMHCLASHTSVRKYTHNIKTTNVPTEFKKTLLQWWDHLKGHYMPYYSYEDEHNDNIGEHNFKVDLVFPTQDHTVDVKVTTPNHVYSLTKVPTDYWRPLGFVPDSTVYSSLGLYVHSIGWVDHCVVHHDHHHMNHHEVHDMVPNQWTLYVGDKAQTPEKAVYIKHVANNQIAVKVVDHSHTIEMVPHGDSHQVTIDGQVVPDQEYHHEDWVQYHVFTHEVHHPVAVMLPQSGFHVEYDGHHVVVLIPKVKEQMVGHCYGHH